MSQVRSSTTAKQERSSPITIHSRNRVTSSFVSPRCSPHRPARASTRPTGARSPRSLRPAANACGPIHRSCKARSRRCRRHPLASWFERLMRRLTSGMQTFGLDAVWVLDERFTLIHASAQDGDRALESLPAPIGAFECELSQRWTESTPVPARRSMPSFPVRAPPPLRQPLRVLPATQRMTH